MIDLNERFSEKRNFFNRLIFVYVFFGVLFLYLIYKTFSLQISSYTDYELASLENKTREFWSNQEEELFTIEMVRLL